MSDFGHTTLDIADASFLDADPWHRLASLTPARIGLGRAGGSLPTTEILKFALAHAQARDAVHIQFDAEKLAADIGTLGFETIQVASAAGSRGEYLRRPDLGRSLSPASRLQLSKQNFEPVDIVVVVGDGLSATAAQTQTVPFLAAFQTWAERAGWSIGPVVIATQARVALADEIGQRMNARAVVMLIGERPGLSSPDSLGVYMTLDPQIGRHDGERNCISNVRAEGLSHERAAFTLAWLLKQAFVTGISGVRLKDESGFALAAASSVKQVTSTNGDTQI